MTFFEYKAIKSDGKSYTDTTEAESKFALKRLLEKKNETIVYARETSERAGPVKRMWGWLEQHLSTVSATQLIAFSGNLSKMLKAGLSLSRSLDVLERQSRNKKLKRILRGAQSSIEGGETLSSALNNYPRTFSPLFVAMVKAGEEGGNLSESLELVSSQMHKNHELVRKVRGAMIYPVIIFIIMIIIGALMMIYVVPTLTDTFKQIGTDLPIQTQIIIFISEFLRTKTLLATGIVLFVMATVYSVWRSKRGRRMFEYVFLHLPLIGSLVKEINSARTARTLSSLLSSGVDMVIALQITEDVIQNSYYKEVIKVARDKIQKGEQISNVFSENSKLYPIFVGEMVSVGEETGNISSMLGNIADYYEDDVSQRTKNMSDIVEPVMMVIIGVFVGFFAISMIMPMYSLVGQF